MLRYLFNTLEIFHPARLQIATIEGAAVAIDPNAMGLRARNGSESTDEVVLLTDKSDSQEQMGFVTAI